MYDSNNNPISSELVETGLPESYSSEYEYDSFNRLISAITKTSSSGPTRTSIYTYVYTKNNLNVNIEINVIEKSEMGESQYSYHSDLYYDENNNLLKRIITDQFKKQTQIQFFYNENGHINRVLNDKTDYNYKYIYSSTNLKTESEIKAISIIASSYIDYQNMYTPDVIFDNNPETGWLEAVDGPGIGQSVTIKFNEKIIVDELKFMPGYFNRKWWKSNNRVKKLNLDYGNGNFDITFKDEMKIQNIKLPEPISFTHITFKIMEVYISGKDNDTGISEIEFWNKGYRITINFSDVNK